VENNCFGCYYCGQCCSTPCEYCDECVEICSDEYAEMLVEYGREEYRIAFNTYIEEFNG